MDDEIAFLPISRLREPKTLLRTESCQDALAAR